MSKIILKKYFKVINTIIEKITQLFKNKKVYYVMGFVFIVSLALYIWSLYDPYLFYRNFHGKYRQFHIYHLSIKLGITALTTGIIFSLQTIFIYFSHNIKKLFKNLNPYLKKHYLIVLNVYIVYICLIYFLKFINNQTKTLLILSPIIVYFVYNIYNYIQETKQNYKKWYLIDSRYFFLGALILLIYTPIFIYFNDKKIAEQLSIYAYYLLVIGVVYEIILGIITKQKD